MPDVLDRTGREIVENEDLVAPLQKRLAEVRADEPGTPRNQHPHSILLIS
jgi:hypothetical protein